MCTSLWPVTWSKWSSQGLARVCRCLIWSHFITIMCHNSRTNQQIQTIWTLLSPRTHLTGHKLWELNDLAPMDINHGPLFTDRNNDICIKDVYLELERTLKEIEAKTRVWYLKRPAGFEPNSSLSRFFQITGCVTNKSLILTCWIRKVKIIFSIIFWENCSYPEQKIGGSS